MFNCCSHISYKRIIQSIWFAMSAIGQPFVFMLTLPLPKDMLTYMIPNKNLMMLHLTPFILLALTAKILWYLFLLFVAYLRGNNIFKLLNSLLLPQTTGSYIGQFMLLGLGYSNLYRMTVTGMDMTIIGLLYFVLMGIASCITVIAGGITIYKILRKQYA